MLIRIWVAIALLLSTTFLLFSQNELASSFEVVVIEVKGCQVTSPEAVRQLSGLGIGTKVDIPGLQIPQAMRRLLDLGIFNDVQIEQTRIEQDLIWLEITIQEAPKINAFTLSGLKANKQKKWLEFLNTEYPADTYFNKQSAQILQQQIEQKLADSQLPFDAYTLTKKLDTLANRIDLHIHIPQQQKEKLGTIAFSGNENLSAHRLQKAMGIPTIRLSGISPDQVFLEQSKQALLARYRQEGFADVQIVDDNLVKDGQKWQWGITIQEGPRYYFGNIEWHGATRYGEDVLQKILDINPGDPFSREQLDTRIHFDPQKQDVSSLYMDYGHLFFQAQVRETGLRGDSIDIIIDLIEGPVAIVSAVNVEGNDRTHEHVILREIYIKPGEPFSREKIMRSQRNLLAMGYFKPEGLDVKTKVNPETSEVAITFVVEERRNDKFELSVSISPGNEEEPVRLIGTLGFSFNNFSLRGLFADGFKGAKGDGQQLGIRAQSSGESYQGYNFSFTEPWFRGKPQSLSFAAFHQRYTDSVDSLDQINTLSVTGGNLRLGQRLPWGNGAWTLLSELGYQHIRLNNFLAIDLDDGTSITEGRFNNFYLNLKLNYQTLDDQFFPRNGSRLELSGQWTPPFKTVNNIENTAADYEWLAYHKYRLTAEKYLPVGNKLVLKGSVKTGILAGYNRFLGAPPFERFELGGNGNSGSQQAAFAGNDVLSLRGYEQSEIEGSENGGGVGFAKITAELRYTLFNTGSARGFVLAFAEGGNAWKSHKNFNPLDLNRSVGLGLRLQLPMFGTIGLDYGIGLDKEEFSWDDWKKHGQLNLIFGFEPE